MQPNLSTQDQALIETMRPQVDKATARAKQIMDKRDINFSMAMNMALDEASIERIDPKFQTGEITFHTACFLIGPYARLDWAIRQLRIHKIMPDEFFPELAGLWTASSPDDSDMKYLRLWKRAWLRNDQKIVVDGSPLPIAPSYQVYRGQKDGDQIGITWTMDREVALARARANTHRLPAPGVLLTATAPYSAIFGYLTVRGKEEIVGDYAKFEFGKTDKV